MFEIRAAVIVFSRDDQNQVELAMEPFSRAENQHERGGNRRGWPAQPSVINSFPSHRTTPVRATRTPPSLPLRRLGYIVCHVNGRGHHWAVPTRTKVPSPPKLGFTKRLAQLICTSRPGSVEIPYMLPGNSIHAIWPHTLFWRAIHGADSPACWASSRNLRRARLSLRVPRPTERGARREEQGSLAAACNNIQTLISRLRSTSTIHPNLNSHRRLARRPCPAVAPRPRPPEIRYLTRE